MPQREALPHELLQGHEVHEVEPRMDWIPGRVGNQEAYRLVFEIRLVFEMGRLVGRCGLSSSPFGEGRLLGSQFSLENESVLDRLKS